MISPAAVGQLLNRGLVESGIAQIALDKSGDISYLARAGARVSTTPSDRQMDYYFRDVAMTVVTAYVFEQCFRLLDTYYSTPLVTQALELNRLGQFARQHFPDRQLSVAELKKLNLSTLTPELRKRMIGNQVKDKSFRLVPTLLESDLAKKGKLSLLDEAVLRQAYFRLNYPEYLEKFMGHQPEQIKALMGTVQQHLDTIDAEVQKEIQKRLNIRPGQEKSLLTRLKKNRVTLTESEIIAIKDKVLSRVENGVDRLVRDGVDAKLLMARLGKMQRSVGWPKIALTLVANIIYFGWLGNRFDVEVLQPWQKKISEERGGTRELVAPAYGALVPGAIAATVLYGLTSKVPVLRKLGPSGQFAVFGLGGLLTYGVSTYLMVMRHLNWLRKNKPIYKPHMPKDWSPEMHKPQVLAQAVSHPPANNTLNRNAFQQFSGR